jgi:hypothetical protein
VVVKLPATAANQANFRFRLRLTSNTSVTDDGWYVDDLQLSAVGLGCPLGVDAIFANGFQ